MKIENRTQIKFRDALYSQKFNSFKNREKIAGKFVPKLHQTTIIFPPLLNYTNFFRTMRKIMDKKLNNNLLFTTKIQFLV